MTKQVIIGCIAVLSLMGCKTETKKMEVTDTIIETKAEAKTETASDYQVGSQVPKDLVCMVNNAYMGKPQIPVPVNGKTYYGCCEMCVGMLNNNETARVGTDPVSNKPVDKTEAFIVLMDKDGKVGYFESKESYMKFKKQF